MSDSAKREKASLISDSVAALMLFSFAIADWRGCFSLGAGAGAAARRFGGCSAVRVGKAKGIIKLEANHADCLRGSVREDDVTSEGVVVRQPSAGLLTRSRQSCEKVSSDRNCSSRFPSEEMRLKECFAVKIGLHRGQAMEC